MKVDYLQVEQAQLEQELADLKQAVTEGFISKRDAITKDLLAVYGHLQHGGSLIDLFDAFHKTGLRPDDGNPKLAIIPCDARVCYLYKRKDGSAIFSKTNKAYGTPHQVKGEGDIKLPPETFEWTESGKVRFKCASPIIPPRIAVQVSARIVPNRYHILFEPENWAESKEPPLPPRDPILGRMLTPNIFGVLATWDLTELERSILKGRL